MLFRSLNRSDNRWINLRSSTPAQNCRNTAIKKNNTSGYKGVSWDKQKSKWFAQIMVDRKHIFLGYHRTPQEAHAAYVAGAKRLHGEFARTE